jgi:hypothetical protein
VIAILPFIYLWCATQEYRGDLLLLASVLIVGTDATIFALRLSTYHVVQLVLAAIVPCLTIATVYLSVSSEGGIASVGKAFSEKSIKVDSVYVFLRGIRDKVAEG